MNAKQPTAIIEAITPLIEGGKYPVRRFVGEELVVEADVFKDGHDVMKAVLKWRTQGAKQWQEAPFQLVDNDRWRGSFSVTEVAVYEYTIEAWGDEFLSWQHEFDKKFKAGLRDLKSEILEGVGIVKRAVQRSRKSKADSARLTAIATRMKSSGPEEVQQIIHSPELVAFMELYPDRSLSTEYKPYLRVDANRVRAKFAAWYEFFPRSAEGKPDSGSTFRDCLPRIDDAKAMGFDVIYFPPIHPIGLTKRKGRNNSVTCQPGEPGVPYAIGNIHQGCPNGGGHRDIAPELGTFEDLEWLIQELHKRGMELAIDFAINCSPDHPYVADHPEWFFKRPDGTIKYAENPPKKYEDVYPLNFHNENWQDLWDELTDVILFWCSKKVRIFRVDNPHTKPVAFWEYLIGKVRAAYPDAIFLSEAFTKPKMMRVLAKAGFQQSYTYFTWRNAKGELIDYFSELTQGEMREYFRGNLFPNTPDILPVYLQQGGRPAFLVRAVLAATLSTVYGIYSGFELCENAGLPGKEEYLDSEKYQFKGRDWNAPGNIKQFITSLNRIRAEHRALQEYSNLRFYHSENDQILFYGKATPSGDSRILVVVNLNPYLSQNSFVHVPIHEYGLAPDAPYQVVDLLSGERYVWHGSRNYIELHPGTKPAHVFEVIPGYPV